MGVKLGLILKEESRLRVFESSVPGRLFRCEKGKTGGWRKLYKELLHNVLLE
jgi:hypothetical protein